MVVPIEWAFVAFALGAFAIMALVAIAVSRVVAQLFLSGQNFLLAKIAHYLCEGVGMN